VTSFLAGAVSTLRLCGLRIVNITGSVSTLDIEKKTGRDLGGWIAVLDNHNVVSLNHADIMAILRQYRNRMEFPWQKTVTVAYKKGLGPHSVVQTADGTCQGVVPEAHSEFMGWYLV